MTSCHDEEPVLQTLTLISQTTEGTHHKNADKHNKHHFTIWRYVLCGYMALDLALSIRSKTAHYTSNWKLSIMKRSEK